MEVKTAEQVDLEQLIAFNTRLFPGKRIPSADYLSFWFERDANAIDDCLILKESTGEIFGQILATKMSYYFCGKRQESVWLFDLIVDDSLRNKEWGIDLLLACMEKHPTSCSTGSGPVALPIHLKMGNKMLGEIRKYVGITSVYGILSSIKRGILSSECFPEQVTNKGQTFNKVSKISIPNLTRPYNEDLFEIARCKEYLQWRFFSGLHSYAFYQKKDSDDYFVVRTTVQKGITVMLLVDYRCKTDDPKGFESIYKAVIAVMRKTHIGVLIVGSSLRIIDAVLESHHFKSVGRPRPVIGFVNTKGRSEDIIARRFAFVTLADSDGETNWV